MGVESALLGSIVTTIGGLLGVVLSKCRCVYKRDDDDCNPLAANSTAADPDGKMDGDGITLARSQLLQKRSSEKTEPEVGRLQ